MKECVKERLYFDGAGKTPVRGDLVWAFMTNGKQYDGAVEAVKGNMVWVSLRKFKGLMYSVYDFKKARRKL